MRTIIAQFISADGLTKVEAIDSDIQTYQRLLHLPIRKTPFDAYYRDRRKYIRTNEITREGFIVFREDF